jgi:hypothetical protein
LALLTFSFLLPSVAFLQSCGSGLFFLHDFMAWTSSWCIYIIDVKAELFGGDDLANQLECKYRADCGLHGSNVQFVGHIISAGRVAAQDPCHQTDMAGKPKSSQQMQDCYCSLIPVSLHSLITNIVVNNGFSEAFQKIAGKVGEL